MMRQILISVLCALLTFMQTCSAFASEHEKASASDVSNIFSNFDRPLIPITRSIEELDESFVFDGSPNSQKVRKSIRYFGKLSDPHIRNLSKSQRLETIENSAVVQAPAVVLPRKSSFSNIGRLDSSTHLETFLPSIKEENKQLSK